MNVQSPKSARLVEREILGKLEPRMRAGFLLFHRELSQGPHELLSLGAALAAYSRDPGQLKDLAYAIWPKLRVFKLSNTKLQFVPDEGEQWFIVEIPGQVQSPRSKVQSPQSA